MRWGAEGGTARLARLGLLVALASALQLLETLVPTPVPWLRLGLGNALVLTALAVWGPREAFWVAAGKVLVGALLTGRLLSPGFFLSLGGTGAATVVMVLASRLSPPLGFVGVSVLGAQAHCLAQLLIASWILVQTPALWSLAPLVGTVSLAAGALSGWIAHCVAGAVASQGGRPSAPP